MDKTVRITGFSQQRAGTGTREWSEISFNIHKHKKPGCPHGCIYCLDGETSILMADGHQKALKDVCIGDEIIGVDESGGILKYKNAVVLNHWQTTGIAYRIVLANGSEMICSGEHRWRVRKGWKYTIGTQQGFTRRPHLTVGGKRSSILGIGKMSNENIDITGLYKRGYLSGIIAGDGHVGEYHYTTRGRKDNIYSFRLALNDKDALDRAFIYLNDFKVSPVRFQFTDKMDGIRTSTKREYEIIKSIVSYRSSKHEFLRGFLSGIFDAEGSFSAVIRITNSDNKIFAMIETALKAFNFDFCYDVIAKNGCSSIRVLGGLQEVFRFFNLIQPAIQRKWPSLEGVSVKTPNGTEVKSIKLISGRQILYDITTSTENFIANGVISHNCYARYNAFTRFKTIATLEDWLHPEIDWKKVKKGWQKRDGVIMFPTQHDITPENLSAASEAISHVLDGQNSILIVSKPHMECIEHLCREFKLYRNTGQILFRFTIGTLEEDVLQAFEPHAPTAKERLECLRYAHSEGFQTSVSAEPLLGGRRTAEGLFQETLPYITDTLWYGFLNKPKQRILERDDMITTGGWQVCTWKSYIQQVTAFETVAYCAALAYLSPKVRLKDNMVQCLERRVIV